MHGSVLPIVVSHGEGRVEFDNNRDKISVEKQQILALRYVDHYHQSTEVFPFNPNGSVDGMTGFSSEDGRVTIMMPHPERTFRAAQFSWCPKEWGDHGPWLKLFLNAREFV